jgi:PAS domain-containing protein
MSSPHSDSTDQKDQNRTRDELVCELVALRDSVKELQAGESKRTQAEEALRQSREMVDKILSASPFAISYFEARKLRLTNQAGVEMFGYQSERECLGMSPEEFKRS